MDRLLSAICITILLQTHFAHSAALQQPSPDHQSLAINFHGDFQYYPIPLEHLHQPEVFIIAVQKAADDEQLEVSDMQTLVPILQKCSTEKEHCDDLEETLKTKACSEQVKELARLYCKLMQLPDDSPVAQSIEALHTQTSLPHSPTAASTFSWLPSEDSVATRSIGTSTRRTIQHDDPETHPEDTWLAVALQQAPSEEERARIIQDADVETLFAQAQAYMQREEFEHAIPLLIQAAQRGYVAAMSALGEYYQDEEKGGLDYKQAKVWLEKAIEGDNTKAAFLLGRMLYHGKGINKDWKYAVTLFENNITELFDNPEALLYSGLCYESQGDYILSRILLQKASSNGNKDAKVIVTGLTSNWFTCIKNALYRAQCKNDVIKLRLKRLNIQKFVSIPLIAAITCTSTILLYNHLLYSDRNSDKYEEYLMILLSFIASSVYTLFLIIKSEDRVKITTVLHNILTLGLYLYDGYGKASPKYSHLYKDNDNAAWLTFSGSHIEKKRSLIEKLKARSSSGCMADQIILDELELNGIKETRKIRSLPRANLHSKRETIDSFSNNMASPMDTHSFLQLPHICIKVKNKFASLKEEFIELEKLASLEKQIKTCIRYPNPSDLCITISTKSELKDNRKHLEIEVSLFGVTLHLKILIKEDNKEFFNVEIKLQRADESEVNTIKQFQLTKNTPRLFVKADKLANKTEKKFLDDPIQLRRISHDIFEIAL